MIDPSARLRPVACRIGAPSPVGRALNLDLAVQLKRMSPHMVGADAGTRAEIAASQRHADMRRILTRFDEFLAHTGPAVLEIEWRSPPRAPEPRTNGGEDPDLPRRRISHALLAAELSRARELQACSKRLCEISRRLRVSMHIRTHRS